MASSRITGTLENISTYGGTGQGRDYTSLATWEAATDYDLVGGTVSEVLEMYDDEVYDEDGIVFAGATVNSTYFRIVRSAPSSRHTGIPGTGVSINAPTATTILSLDEANFSLQDISITGTGAGNVVAVKINAADVSCVGVMVHDLTTAGTSNTVRGFHITATGDVALINCLASDIVNGPSASQGQGILHGSGSTTYLYNCTVVNCQYYGISRNLGTVVARNCIVTGTTSNDDFNGTFDATSDYNASQDTSAPGTNSNTSSNFTFQDQSGNDFHLTSGDADARDDGEDLSGVATWAFDDDIDFTTITTWSKGFDSEGALISGVGGIDVSECLGTPDEVSVVNGALAAIGVTFITGFNDGTKQAAIVRQLYASTRCRLQQKYRWEFCLRRLQYTSADVVAGVPTWGFTYAFLLPTNLIQLWEVDDPHESPKYRMENKYLLINETDPDILYSVEEPDPDKWSCSFQEAFEYLLAARLAMPLLHKPEIMQMYMELHEQKVREAAFMNDIQSDDYTSYSSVLAGARYGFSARDITLDLS